MGKQHLRKAIPSPNSSGKEAVQVFSGAVMWQPLYHLSVLYGSVQPRNKQTKTLLSLKIGFNYIEHT